MYSSRTDLALDAALALETRGEAIPVQKQEYTLFEVPVTKIVIDNQAAAESLGKPFGTYITVHLHQGWERDNDAAMRCAKAIAQELTPMLPPEGNILVVGLGNSKITADAIGPEAIPQIVVTRHLKERMPDSFVDFHSVSALSPGVLGVTGVETGEVVKGVFDKIGPSAIIAIDALATSDKSRLCTTFQLTDTGITPGSGVGNPRFALTKEAFGVPVVAIGIPTVVDAAELCDAMSADEPPLIVTPKDIDILSQKSARLIATAVNLALHEKISPADLMDFML